MQAVRIVEEIVAQKQVRRVVPAHATKFEIYQRFCGTRTQMIRELNIAVANKVLIEGKTINDKYYKPYEQK